ncbi:hypothetical protein B0H14DRAFT_3858026 [Mycena olivaceomarginata]|nr:hypothetical protein B0H14DRAFT_3858026 [Mycena olivaceomarginata]
MFLPPSIQCSTAIYQACPRHSSIVSRFNTALKGRQKTRQGTRLTTTQCSVANPCQSPIAKPIPAAVSILGIVSSCFQHQQTRIIPIPQREVVSPAMPILYGRLFAAWAAIGTDLMGVFLLSSAALSVYVLQAYVRHCHVIVLRAQVCNSIPQFLLFSDPLVVVLTDQFFCCCCFVQIRSSANIKLI